MDERDAPRVKGYASVRIGTGCAVLEVSLDWAAYSGKLTADLMMPSREEFDLHKVISLRRTEETVAETGVLRALAGGRADKRLVQFFVTDKPVLQRSFLRVRLYRRQGPVAFVDISGTEELAEALERLGGLRKHDDAADRAVKTVGDAHKDVAALAVALRNESLQRFADGLITGLVSLDYLSGLLVEDEEVIVLVENPAFDGPVFFL